MNKTSNENMPKDIGICIECQTGVLQLRQLTYFTWLDDELITVPNFPAYVCDICGRREFDGRSVTLLKTLLNPETGRRSRNHRRPGSPRADQAHT